MSQQIDVHNTSVLMYIAQLYVSSNAYPCIINHCPQTYS